ncbi:mycofactocin precursor MftA [Mycobacterium sp.]|nr:mycofactocin precursor MftA [Mycobacterium sp.]HTU06960.1 mycofactocin precursor MftA [Trebonia sp.]
MVEEVSIDGMCGVY